MRINIVQSTSWISAKSFKAFLLVGTASISCLSLYTPITSQANNLKEKLNDSNVVISPFSRKLITSSGKLFEQLSGWAKTSANTSEEIKKWISIIAKGNISNGTIHIFKTSKEWGLKIYEIFKESIR